jgi:AcrR family transcriptional regulator
VPGSQRLRMARALTKTMSDQGYQGATVKAIVATAGASRRTFYEHFTDRDDCLLAAIDDAVARLGELAATAYEEPEGWPDQVRYALEAILGALQQDPAIADVLLVESLRAGPKVLARRVQITKALAKALDHGCPQIMPEIASLTAETVVGGAITIVQAEFAEQQHGRLLALVSPLTAAIILPYLGPQAAAKEFARRNPSGPKTTKLVAGPSPEEPGPSGGSPMRMTHRSAAVLAAISRTPGAANWQIAEAAGVLDKGQISRLLSRLQRLELIKNLGERPRTGPHEWHLTDRGIELRRELAMKLNG